MISSKGVIHLGDLAQTMDVLDAEWQGESKVRVMNMVVLALPRLVSGRDLAAGMVAGLGNITDDEVVVDARATTTGTGSFAAGVVRGVLVNGSAKRLVIVGAPPDFDGYVKDAARKLGLPEDRIETVHTMPAGATA